MSLGAKKLGETIFKMGGDSENRFRREDFCKKAGFTTASLHRYINEKRKPSANSMSKIEEITDGLISPPDWLTPAPKDEEALQKYLEDYRSIFIGRVVSGRIKI